AVLRAGACKPRTKPGGFAGYGAEALAWIVNAARECGLPSCTEVATATHVRAAIDAGIDMLWIGARTTANPFAVQEIADTLAAMGASVPVLVKNPVSPDLELWIGALERINAAGITRMAAVHRGFSTYGDTYYRNSPQWRVPIELHRRIPGLSLICDPSHIAGRSEIVDKVARDAADLGFDGLMIEVHCHPSEALSDSRQQLTPGQLKTLMDSLRVCRTRDSGSERLAGLRAEIDNIDDRLLSLLAERMAVTDEVGRLKQREGMPVVQPERYNALMGRRSEEAAARGLDPAFVRSVLAAIHEESVRRQLDIVSGQLFS
ncbi:MAG: bifunctional 3-deoxy-7-phosphoheptulonate synthase/chorismate mutase type II, partial [Muribaculaceae bacterium]|nr:bifunctional 3-deoxy-7-phosphoheptulonate synthase/chorismate mutase type II [Muribaculaceae bacterium]